MGVVSIPSPSRGAGGVPYDMPCDEPRSGHAT